MNGRTLVDAYLSELTEAARILPKERGAELVADVRDHIEAALGDHVDEETVVRNVLQRVGSPDEIIAAEREERASVPIPTRSLTPAGVAIAVLTGLVVLLLAVLSGTSGLPAAGMALAFAVVTPYVWIPLVFALLALAARREPQAASRGRGAASWAPAGTRHRISPSLLGLCAIVVLLFIAQLANGLVYMGVVAVLTVPLLVLLLLVEVLRGRRR